MASIQRVGLGLLDRGTRLRNVRQAAKPHRRSRKNMRNLMEHSVLTAPADVGQFGLYQGHSGFLNIDRLGESELAVAWERVADVRWQRVDVLAHHPVYGPSAICGLKCIPPSLESMHADPLCGRSVLPRHPHSPRLAPRGCGEELERAVVPGARPGSIAHQNRNASSRVAEESSEVSHVLVASTRPAVMLDDFEGVIDQVLGLNETRRWPAGRGKAFQG